MKDKFSKFLDQTSNFLSQKKGLLPMIGLILIIINFVIVLSSQGWLANTNFFLHIGASIAILGFLIAWAL